MTEHPETTLTLFDFADPNAAGTCHAIDDRVMGGLSRSRLRHDPEGHATFEGIVSHDRHGGFASVRSAAGQRGLPEATTCRIEVRGDARVFKLSLVTDDTFDGLVYQQEFRPTPEHWRTLDLPIAHFRPRFRGRGVEGAATLDPVRIRQVGLLVAIRQAGPFRLDIRRIDLARPMQQ